MSVENVLAKQRRDMQMMTGEYEGLRKVLEYLWAGDQDAFNALYFIKSNYKEWGHMFLWLKRNQLTGKKLVALFQNESVDGGGYHMGATYILSRLKGHKHNDVMIKVDELL